jgi:hypothetical protein
LSFREGERTPVCTDAQDSEYSRTIASYLSHQLATTFGKFFSGKLRGGCCRSGYYVRHPQADLQQLALLKRRQQTIRESGIVECGPEPVSRASKMMSHCTGVQAGVYPAKEHAQPGPDQIRHRLFNRGEKLVFGGLKRFY